MYFVKTPEIVKKIFSKNILWEKYSSDKTIYLTFDDGPNPDVTPFVLTILDQYTAKASFFCLGKNVETFPDLTQQILNNGHCIGNHSYSHKNGWTTKTKEYISDVEKSTNLISSKLFRPPFGKITFSQLNLLKNKYNIVMWSLMSGDFDHSLSNEKCLLLCTSYTKNGTIIVFHDTLKAKEKLMYVLPKYLDYYSKLGYSFLSL